MLRQGSGPFFIAVDAGGTYLRAACFSSDSIEPIQIKRIPTRDDKSLPTERLITLISNVWPTGRSVSSIALAVPGAVNPHEGIIYTTPNIQGWHELPLRKIISEHFKVPALIGNDANLAALGEWKYGAGQGCQNLIYFTVSTGIGGGVIDNGKLILGQRGLAAEVGHITVDPQGPLCGCGQIGHLEAIASGPAIVRWVNAEINAGETTSLKKLPNFTAKDISEAANNGDALAMRAFQRAGFWFGRSLADFIHLFNPDVVVIGGGVSRSGDLFLKPVLESMKKHAISPRYYEHLKISLAKLGDEAGLIGALVLAQSAKNLQTMVK